MIILLKPHLTDSQVSQICETLKKHGLANQVATTARCKLVVVHDQAGSTLPGHFFSSLDGVERVISIETRCPLALNGVESGISFPGGTTVGGGSPPVLIAGPCAVEGRLQIAEIAAQVKQAGAKLLRGGAFKPRTSPYDFSGLGLEALKHLQEARQATGLPVVSEVMSAGQVELAEPFVDMLQIGARNMYNYELLKEVGRSNRPVLLKRAMSATISELLQAAEYIMLEGNLQIILCERGIRTFETHTRNTLDLSAVAAIKSMSQLPVLVDPSHGTGRPELVRPMSRAAIACGADGLMIEVHNEPCRAFSDGSQAITPSVLKEIAADMQAVYQALGAGGRLSTPGSALPALQAART